MPAGKRDFVKRTCGGCDSSQWNGKVVREKRLHSAGGPVIPWHCGDFETMDFPSEAVFPCRLSKKCAGFIGSCSGSV